MNSPVLDARAAIVEWLVGTLDEYSHDVDVSPDTGHVDVELLDPESFAGAMIDNWDRLTAMVRPSLAIRREARRQEQRDTGQVWWLVYYVHGHESRTECFSLGEAQAVAVALIDNQTGWPTRIEQPSGPTITGNEVWERQS